MLNDLDACAFAPRCHHQVQHRLAQAAADVEEVAVRAEAHGLDCTQVLSSALLVRRSKLDLTQTEFLEDLDHQLQAPSSRLTIAQARSCSDSSLDWALASVLALLLLVSGLALPHLRQPGCVLEAPRVSKMVHGVDGLVQSEKAHCHLS